MSIRFNLIRIISRIHGYVYSISKGRVGKRLGSQTFLLLTTVGRKSGKKRTVPLAAITHNNGYILVASFGGSPVNPAWLINIQRNPKIEFQIGAVVKQAKASIVETTNHCYEELWEKAVASYKGYNDYKKATSRHIPIVLIKPYED